MTSQERMGDSLQKPPLYSRREFFRLVAATSSVAGLTACNSQFELPFILKERQIKRAIGRWNEEEVKALAEKMVGESQLDYVALAGQILLDNKNGDRSFSKLSPFFSDQKVRITTKNIDPREGILSQKIKSVPAEAAVDSCDSSINFNLRLKTDGSLKSFSFYSCLQLKEISLDYNHIVKGSDFLIKFLVSKEILNVLAFDLAASYFADKIIEDKYEIPQQNNQNLPIIKANLFFNNSPGNISALGIMDLWAHFLLIPNYLTAVSLEKFQLNEASRSNQSLGFFQFISEVVQKKGFLKNSQGIYQWKSNTPETLQLWEQLTLAVVANLKK